jgi:hypothetical protein
MGKKDGGGGVALFNLERINAFGGENKRSFGKGTYPLMYRKYSQIGYNGR